MTEPTSPPDSHPITIALNPLRWPQAEEGMRILLKQAPDSENLLRFLRAPFAQAGIDDFVRRYQTLSAHDAGLFAAPVHPRIIRGILQPVHNAKAAFVLGHFASCIGLCGVAAEMLAVFRFDIADSSSGGQPLDDARRRHLWGTSFEGLRQSVRSSALFALGLINEEALALFKRVSGIRNKYVHSISRDAECEEADATQVYRATLDLTTRILGLSVDGTQVALHPDVVRFLSHEGPLGRSVNGYEAPNPVEPTPDAGQSESA